MILLTSCNQKPVETSNEPMEEVVTYIDRYEKISDGIVNFQSPLHQGMEYISYYRGLTLTSEDRDRIFTNVEAHYVSTVDLLNLLKNKNAAILPQYGDVNSILESLSQNQLVLAEYLLVGSIKNTSIFYGYSERNLFYIDVPSLKKRQVPIEKLIKVAKGGNGLDLYLTGENNDVFETNINSSKLYWTHESRDVFYKKDDEKYTELIQKIEGNQWVDDFKYSYAYYYIFIDPQPQKVEDVVQKLLKELDYIFHQELAFMLYVKSDNEKMANEILQKMQVQDNLREETLYEMGIRLLDMGRKTQAIEVFGILQGKNSNYPGLKEALEKVQGTK